MATRNGVIGLLRRIAAPAGTDAELLARFAAAGDQAAFEALVHRHAAMVFGVCRRVLRNDADAEDAFQATFLVLARKAGEVANRAALSGWLYGVAYRTALKLRTHTLNRRAKEANVPARQTACNEPALPSDLGAVLDEELQHLSDAYRDALLLCDVEGLSRRDAATRLGVAEGTLSGRLCRARRLLAGRLRRRGVTLAAGLVVLGQTAQAAPPATALSGVVAAAKAFAAGLPLAEASVSARVVTLTTGVLKAMYLQKLVSTMAALALVALVALGLAGYATFGAPTPKAETPAAKADGGPVNLQLLTHRKVIRELKCTEEQWDRIDDALEKATADTVKDFNAARQVPAGPGGPPPALPDIGRIAETHRAAAEKEITGKVLLPAQVARLRQIERQARGPWAFQITQVEAALKMTDRQKAKVKELIAELHKQARKNREALNPAGAADPAAWVPDTAPTVKAIVKELSAEQAATWKDLTGDPVKFDLKKIAGLHQHLTERPRPLGPPGAPGGGPMLPGPGGPGGGPATGLPGR